ncbi:MAG: hypothetical protein LQ339_007236 [Xanthoria mediterranea]|nr:MAG: hypothetical protein LQ339_007236 [Xanthoria mediterranea]
MALIALAESAQDIATGFNRFLDPLPESSTEITALISECFAISSALRLLDTAKEDPRYYLDYEYIYNDVAVVRDTLDYTFTDVTRLFGGLDRPFHISRRTAFRQVWQEIDDFFYQESNASLCRRLEDSRIYLTELGYLLMDGTSGDEYRIQELRDRLETLFEIQQLRLASTMNNLSLGDAGAPRQRSFERRRPLRLSTRPREPPPGLRGGAGRYPGPMSPQSPPGFDHDYYPWCPAAPEVPTSPTTTTTFSTLSSSASASFSPNHWLPGVFYQTPPTTSFRQTGAESKCYGEDIPGASARLAREYDKLLEATFEDGDLQVRLFHRASDQRARIHCRVSRNGRFVKQCCLPLTKLSIQREASTLKFYRMGDSRRLKDIWVRLRFPSYERLVLFHCAFIALRSEDGEKPVELFDDHEMHGEKSIYAGKIRDDEFLHALRVYKDRDCGGIRLQASVLRGELKRKPVWTAFITTHVESQRWMRQAGPKTIHLADLQRFVFAEAYTPQLGPQGQHELQFESSQDAREFMNRINELADDQMQHYH